MEVKETRYVTSELYEKTDFTQLFRITYLWLAIGLMVSGVTAYFLAANPEILIAITKIPGMQFIVLIAVFGTAIAMTNTLRTNASSTKTMILYLIFCLVEGFSLSTLFFVFTKGTIANAFLLTGGIFLAMTAYGYTSNRELSGMRAFLMMGLVGLIIASILNIFFWNDTFMWLTSVLGVVIFGGFVAYDTNQIKKLALQLDYDRNPDLARKIGIVAAFQLFLDFINIFIYLLRILGGSSNRR